MGPHLRCVGLCGVDDSVDPGYAALPKERLFASQPSRACSFLQMLYQRFPYAEFGVLFRPDKQGTMSRGETPHS
eukprot:6141846-Prorocentrum_lima.AAC.1